MQMFSVSFTLTATSVICWWRVILQFCHVTKKLFYNSRQEPFWSLERESFTQKLKLNKSSFIQTLVPVSFSLSSVAQNLKNAQTSANISAMVYHWYQSITIREINMSVICSERFANLFRPCIIIHYQLCGAPRKWHWLPRILQLTYSELVCQRFCQRSANDAAFVWLTQPHNCMC